MTNHSIICLVRLVRDLFILVCLILPLGGCTPSDREKASFSIELSNYYWESEEVLHIGGPLPWNNGMKEIDILVVELQVTNESNQEGWISFRSWYVLDDNGDRFDITAFDDIPFEKDLRVTVIQPGETVIGQVAFEVPSGHLPLWVHCSKCTTEVEIR